MTPQIISYPRMGNYHIVLDKAVKILFPSDTTVITPPPITAKTLEIGTCHSPENVCSPFKYNIGNFVEVLEKGANVLLQTGTGCIFGYYGDVQEKILQDLGYEFTFLCFGRGSTQKAYDRYREIGGKLTFPAVLKAIAHVFSAMGALDRFEYFMRENIAFETVTGSFENLHRQFIYDLERAKLHQMPLFWHRYKNKLTAIKLDKPKKPMRVGLVGELFTLMEPAASFNIERELTRHGVSVSRKMNVSYLTGSHTKKSMRVARGYLSHPPGANGADSVAQALQYANAGYDGVIHLQSFGCTPELNVIPALNQVSHDTGIPVLHMSFDTHTGEAGVQTRLEAFVDMLEMRR